MKIMQVVKSVPGCFKLFDGENFVKAKAFSVNKQSGIIVGDYVETIEVNGEFVISKVCERKSELIRPVCANIDQLLIVIAETPKPDFLLIDKLLLKCFMLGIKPIIAINKCDVNSKEFTLKVQEIYSFTKVIKVSAKEKIGINELNKLLENNLTAFAGQSAVGKSSLLNTLCPGISAEIGELSEKTERGKNTTRHSEIFVVNSCSKVIDTPGFSMFNIADLEPNQIAYFMPDFTEFSGGCKFQPCEHIKQKENICAVRKAVSDGKISKERYDNYVKIYSAQMPVWKRRNSYE